MTVNLLFHDRQNLMGGHGLMPHCHSMGRVFLSSFASVSKAILRQLSVNKLGFSLGVFHREVQFVLTNTETFHNIESEWRADPGFFLLGLVDSYLGASISFTTYMNLPEFFWTHHFPLMLEDACDQLILASIHDA